MSTSVQEIGDSQRKGNSKRTCLNEKIGRYIGWYVASIYVETWVLFSSSQTKSFIENPSLITLSKRATRNFFFMKIIMADVEEGMFQ